MTFRTPSAKPDTLRLRLESLKEDAAWQFATIADVLEQICLALGIDLDLEMDED